MKRIKAACICQTLHFQLKEDVDHAYAVSLVRQEVEQYKRGMDLNRTQYKIVEETAQPDGSILLKGSTWTDSAAGTQPASQLQRRSSARLSRQASTCVYL